MKIAAIQMNSTPCLQENLTVATALLHEAAKQNVKLAALPEYFCALSQSKQAKLKLAEHHGNQHNAPIQTMLAKTAKELGIWIVAGSLPLRDPEISTHIYNSCLVYNNQGKEVTRYDKIHLFRFENETESYNESDLYFAGAKPQTFMLHADEEQYKCGLSICYDLRFPELYRQLSAPNTQPCDIIFVPSAFTYTTGQAHWEVLLRARAIENQCYIVAPAQSGYHAHQRRTWGHSMIIDPWGEILTVEESQANVIVAEISSERLSTVRAQLPALANRMLTD